MIYKYKKAQNLVAKVLKTKHCRCNNYFGNQITKDTANEEQWEKQGALNLYKEMQQLKSKLK